MSETDHDKDIITTECLFKAAQGLSFGTKTDDLE